MFCMHVIGQCFSTNFISSAIISTPERVFSLLQNSFNHQQQASLEDYISLSVMLQYNRVKSSEIQVIIWNNRSPDSE